MKDVRKTNSGFTLIEVMVVLVILSILGAVSIPIYSNYANKSKINEAVTNMGAIATACRIYYTEKGTWPALETTISTSAAYKVDGVKWYYFQIKSWVGTKTNLIITIEDKNFDVDGEFTYTMDSTGSAWADVGSDEEKKILKKYALNLLQ